MGFLQVGTAPKVKPKKQRLYILRITLLSGLTIIKIGKASGHSSKERMLQICASIYDKYRTTPAIKIVRDQEVSTDDVFKFETTLHQYFTDYQYTHQNVKKFDGVTECFVIPEDDAIQAYEAVLEGLVPEEVYTMPEPVKEDKIPF